MPMLNARSLLFRAFLLDGFGLLFILSLITWTPSTFGYGCLFHVDWSVELVVIHSFSLPIHGWLFGSYTVLRWRRLPLSVLFQRLFITTSFCVFVIALARWLFNPDDSVWLVYRRVQLIWMLGLTFWSFTVRLALRRGLLSYGLPRLMLLSQPNEVHLFLTAWRRVPHRQRLSPVHASRLIRRLDQPLEPLLVAVSDDVRRDPSYRSLLRTLEMCDPRIVRTVSVLRLFESQQERLPPIFMADMDLIYDDLPWAAPFSVQTQLKRTADVLFAFFLLLITAPFVAFAAFLIWLEDRGPIFYSQSRSGWLGRPFIVRKLRTMSVQPEDAPAVWTQVSDQRITSVGRILRRFRFDELPQLLNVLNGEMSLIGPRPERPEIENSLELSIPHYRMRHWMRPGLSGWAQVCAPYASSIEDSDLKLSYDLYYLRHFSIWLDFVILFRTIKTVLKAGGR